MNSGTQLMSESGDQDLAPTSLGLSHILARYNLNLKVETMIIETIGNLDDLDKKLNVLANWVRKCYEEHFPELATIIPDNILYAKSVKLMGNRINAANLDFSEILAEEVEAELKEAAAVISMGTTQVNEMQIRELCDEVLSLAEYRAELYDNLKSRMKSVAPNLTALVGELVGARLISRGGSLLNLSKQPASRIQLLGKTKHGTIRHVGLIYDASVVGKAPTEHKQKIARSLSAKIALAARCDVYGDGQDNTMGVKSLAKLEARLRDLEVFRSAKGKPKVVDDYVNAKLEIKDLLLLIIGCFVFFFIVAIGK